MCFLINKNVSWQQVQEVQVLQSQVQVQVLKLVLKYKTRLQSRPIASLSTEQIVISPLVLLTVVNRLRWPEPVVQNYHQL